MSVSLIWFPIIKNLIEAEIKPGSRLYVSWDRTQWKQNHLFMAAVIWQKRAWPIYWQFLSKQGSTNLVQQQALLRPVLKLLSSYEIVVIGDREFRSVQLAQWLDERGVYFALRQKHNTYIQIETQQYKPLNTLGIGTRSETRHQVSKSN